MSPTGRTVALVAVAALSALWLPVAVAAVAVAVVLVAWVLDTWSVRQPPAVARTMPAELVRGVPASFRVEVTDRPGIGVAVRQPQAADLRFTPADGQDGLDGQVLATKRGRHELGPMITRSTGRLGLGRWDHRHGETTFIDAHADLPGARRIAGAVRQGRFSDPGRRRGPLGLGTDFESVRDYTPDDDIRRMNWTATERTGRPMVNQYREDTERDLWCLVDAGRLLASPLDDRTRLDAALDALAAVAAVADVVGDRVGAVVFDDQVRRVIWPRRAGAAALVRLLDDVEPVLVDSDYDAAFSQVTGLKRSLVIVFTDLLDAAAARPLIDAVPVMVRRHAVLVVGAADPDLARAVTTDPRTTRELHVASVATDLLSTRERARAELGALGAVVLDAPAEQLASACVGAYLRLKSTARL